MKIEIVQIAGRDGDTAYNVKRVLEAIASAAAGTDIIMFPESQITGFLDAGNVSALAEPLDGPSIQAVRHAARERNVAVVVGLTENDGGDFYNTTLFITRKVSRSATARPTCGCRNLASSYPATGTPPWSGRACGSAS